MTRHDMQKDDMAQHGKKHFIPGCVGKGLDLDLRIRPAAPAASGNPGLGPLGIEIEEQGFRTAWLITGQKFP